MAREESKCEETWKGGMNPRERGWREIQRPHSLSRAGTMQLRAGVLDGVTGFPAGSHKACIGSVSKVTKDASAAYNGPSAAVM